MNIILASASPRRKKILKKQMKMKFKVIVAKVEEKTKYKKPHKIVMELSKLKALSVAKKYPQSIVIGADTIVYCNGKIIGKPKDSQQAKRFLKIQSGRWQSVYTGITVVLLKNNIVLTDYEKSLCYMRRLTEKEINQISKKHLDKAGGWAVQDKNDKLITKIKGDYTNVVGFPVKLVKTLLEKVKNNEK